MLVSQLGRNASSIAHGYDRDIIEDLILGQPGIEKCFVRMQGEGLSVSIRSVDTFRLT